MYSKGCILPKNDLLNGVYIYVLQQKAEACSVFPNKRKKSPVMTTINVAFKGSANFCRAKLPVTATALITSSLIPCRNSSNDRPCLAVLPRLKPSVYSARVGPVYVSRGSVPFRREGKELLRGVGGPRGLPGRCPAMRLCRGRRLARTRAHTSSAGRSFRRSGARDYGRGCLLPRMHASLDM